MHALRLRCVLVAECAVGQARCYGWVAERRSQNQKHGRRNKLPGGLSLTMSLPTSLPCDKTQETSRNNAQSNVGLRDGRKLLLSSA